MVLDGKASQDFERALGRAFWRKILSKLTGQENELLPFDEIRQHLKIRGQHYVGFQQVAINQIVGSTGRYRDFDRAFMPIQTRTRERWISVDKAHYRDIPLPPVDLIKMGEVYFVRDGNHRVSVARERGQTYIDAYVIEIDIPFEFTPDMDFDDVLLKQEQAEFQLETNIKNLRSQANIAPNLPGASAELLEHIAVHRWYLGTEKQKEIHYPDAVASWYDNVYLPVIEIVREERLLRIFPKLTEADIYLLVMKYHGFLTKLKEISSAQDIGEIQKKDQGGQAIKARALAAQQLAEDHPSPMARRLVRLLESTEILDELILRQQRAAFLGQTQLHLLVPDAEINLSLPGQYEKLRQHIDSHRWFLGENRREDVPYFEAVKSWYENVYLPLVSIIRDVKILEDFPGRTESDLYLWIIEHRWHLQQTYGEDVSLKQAVEKFADNQKIGKTRRIKKRKK